MKKTHLFPHIFPLMVGLACLLLQACQFQDPSTEEPTVNKLHPTPTARLQPSQTFHYHDGQSAMAREMTIQRNADGSVTVQRSDVAFAAATNRVGVVTLDSDPIPPNSNPQAYYNAGSDAWFIPFDNGQAVPLTTGGGIYVECYCDRNTTPDWDDCFVDGPYGKGSWECLPGDCDRGCSAKIVFRNQNLGPGVTLKANQIIF
ncbi:MAG: hypothetical protein AAF570_03145 [Bacteroidota bacterium]